MPWQPQFDETRAPLRFDAVSIFPEFFEGFLRFGVVGRAMTHGMASFGAVDLRNFTHDKHRTVDDRPFGGGEGMVLKPEPLAEAIESLGIALKAERDPKRETVILLSAQGRKFTQSVAQELAGLQHIVMVCGRYEGVDERVNECICDRELSIGDYVLSGGELGAAVIADAVVRLLPGVLGNNDSSHYESFGHAHHADRDDTDAPLAVSASGGLLDYPHYTRPAEFRGVAVPEVLTGGDHRAIQMWRREQALSKTLRNRADLLAEAELSREDRRILDALRQREDQS